jgi:hypothetical protein
MKLSEIVEAARRGDLVERGIKNRWDINEKNRDQDTDSFTACFITTT